MVNYYTGQLSDIFRSNKQYTFLVGAGISMDPPSNIPSAREMGRILLEFCAVKDEVGNLLALNTLRYEMIVEQVQLIFDTKLIFLDYFDSVVNPNMIHLFLANMIIAGHNIITTNFDYCIEHALIKTIGDQNKGRIQLIITKEDYQIYEKSPELAKSRFILAKIHGSKKNIITGCDTSSSLITTMSALGKEREKGETFAIEPFKKPTVLSLTKNRNLVVMGYSGSDDFDIGPVLKELPNLESLIWIEHGSGQSDAKGAARSDMLLSEIEKKVKFPVILLRANTIELVQKTLWKYLLPKIPVPSVESLPASKAPHFREFAQSLYKDNAELRKYQLTSRLFYDLVQYDSVLRVSRTGLDLAKKAQDLQVQSYFLSISGSIYYAKGDYDNALKNYTEALKIDEQLGNLQKKSGILNNIGQIYYAKGDYDGALKNYTEALKIDEQLGDLQNKALFLNNIGSIYDAKGDYDAALKNYTEALKIAEQLGNLQNKALFLNNIGSIYNAKGDYDGALKNFTETLKIDEQLGDLKGKAIDLNNIGQIYDAKGDYDGALKNYTEALKIAEQLGDLQNKALFLNNIGSIYKTRGVYDNALKNYTEALKIDEQLGDLQNKALFLNNIGSIYDAKGDYDAALKTFNEILELNKKLGAQQSIAGNLWWIASISSKKGKKKEALKSAEEALALYRKMNLTKEAKKREDFIMTLK